MSLDKATVTGIARLARIRVSDDDIEELGEELGRILGWVEQLEEVDTSDAGPWSGFMAFRRENIEAAREDVVADGDRAEPSADRIRKRLHGDGRSTGAGAWKHGSAPYTCRVVGDRHSSLRHVAGRRVLSDQDQG